jgi:polysaccharide export outer membrane protein
MALMAVSLSGTGLPVHARGAKKPHLDMATRLPDVPQDQEVLEGKDKGFAPGDRLAVDVFGLPDLSRAVTVNTNGEIQLPMIGTVKAADETGQTLAAIVRARLMERYVRDPEVTVALVAAAAQSVWVRGDVRTPGAVEVTPRTSLLSALDIADIRDLKTVDAPILLFRTVDGNRLIARYSLSQLRAGTVKLPPLYGGDVIHVGPDKLSAKDLKTLTPKTGTFYQLAAFPPDMVTRSGE